MAEIWGGKGVGRVFVVEAGTLAYALHFPERWFPKIVAGNIRNANTKRTQ